MKIKIVIEDKKKGKIEIPITEKEVNDWLDFGFMISTDDDYYKTLKLNHVDESFWKFHTHAGTIQDALSDGKCYTFENGKMKEAKTKYYFNGKKPRWKK